jgi:hypothetical protein
MLIFLLGFTALLGASFGQYNSYEPNSRHGKIIDAYVERSYELGSGAVFEVWEVISYPRTHHGETFHRNCSFYLTDYATRAHAENYANTLTLGGFRTIYPSKKTSKCINEYDLKEKLITGCVVAFIVFPILLCTVAAFRIAYVELNTEDAVVAPTGFSPLVQMVAVSSARSEAVSHSRAEASV